MDSLEVSIDKISFGFALGDVPGVGFAQFDAILADLQILQHVDLEEIGSCNLMLPVIGAGEVCQVEI